MYITRESGIHVTLIWKSPSVAIDELAIVSKYTFIQLVWLLDSLHVSSTHWQSMAFRLNSCLTYMIHFVR